MRVAPAALQGDKTMAEFAQEFELHSTMINVWRQQLVEHAAVTAEPLVAFLLGLGHQQAHEIEIDRTAGDDDAESQVQSLLSIRFGFDVLNSRTPPSPREGPRGVGPRAIRQTHPC